MNKSDIILNINGVSQQFGDNKVLYDVDIKVARGQFLGICGFSGAGKSTLLKSIEGTLLPFDGEVLLDNIPITYPSRHIGMVHQKYNLYDFLTVEENVAFGLMLDQTHLGHRFFHPFWWNKLRSQHLEDSRQLLSKIKLEKTIKKYPSELSGGMQQRVAIAQSLIMKPKILLLDEPFGALDESTREELQKLLLVLYQENMQAIANDLPPPYTVILITHELNEAFYCCDRVIALSRSWCHETSKGKIYGKDLGATKVYDKAAPIYKPSDPKNFDLFCSLIKELREIMFNPNDELDRYEHVSFWGDLAQGVGTGVAKEYFENEQ